MTERKHTAGPWYWQVTALRGTLHGGPAGTTHVMACDAEDLPERLDASLIEAAPDLLKALKRIMDHYGFIPGGPDFPDAWEAIRKAEVTEI